MADATSKSPSEKGALAELAVATALTKIGLPVFVPFFASHARIDLMYVNASGVVRRLQCKFARLVNDCVTFYTCSHTGGIERQYVGEVDEFGVYCAETGLVYVVPIDDLPTRVASLRVTPTRNGQSERVRWAAPYVVGPP